ncbi:flagellar brake protein [Lachnospiraceae bacterium ZAX-1]
MMLKDILTAGDKVDVRFLRQDKEEETFPDKKPKIYQSVIDDVLDNNLIEIAMPTDKGRMVLLNIGFRYEMLFYTEKGMYSCITQVKERLKTGNRYSLYVEIQSRLLRNQRREYYRFETTMDIQYLEITKEEATEIPANKIEEHHKQFYPQDEVKHAMTIDISGGGVRFAADEKRNVKSYVLVKMLLMIEDIPRQVFLIGQLMKCERIAGTDPIKYDHRIQYFVMDPRISDLIIKYIFEEERKIRKKILGG